MPVPRLRPWALPLCAHLTLRGLPHAFHNCRQKLLTAPAAILPKLVLGVARSAAFLTGFIALAFGGERLPPLGGFVFLLLL